VSSLEAAPSPLMQQTQPGSGPAAPRSGSEYAQLSRQVKQAGLLNPRPSYYAWKITLTLVLLAAGWAVFAVLGDSWWQLAVAVFLAIMFTQVGFLGHDAGHRQIFRSRKANYVLGVLLGNLGIGLSYGWWVSKHNRHHAHPNQQDADPDIVIGVLAFSETQARNARGLARLTYRFQAYLFFPMLLLEAVSLPPRTLREVSTCRCRKPVRSVASRMGMPLWFGAKEEPRYRPNRPCCTRMNTTALTGESTRNTTAR
jgi:fatty acid desaturase